MRFLLDSVFPDPFILSAERFGISLFYRELDFTKNQLVDLLQKMSDNKNRDTFSPYLFIDRTTSRYSLPIKDNIDYTRSIPDLRGRRSQVYENKLFDDIKDMMGGYYGAAGDDIRFISKARGKGRSFNIPLHLASSSARGLSDFYFFLRHGARSNHSSSSTSPRAISIPPTDPVGALIGQVREGWIESPHNDPQRLPHQGDQQSRHAEQTVCRQGFHDKEAQV